MSAPLDMKAVAHILTTLFFVATPLISVVGLLALVAASAFAFVFFALWELLVKGGGSAWFAEAADAGRAALSEHQP